MFFKFFFVNLLYFFFNFINLKKNSHFRILMFHDIKKKNFSNLQNSLQSLKKSYNFIDPNQLKEKYILKDKNNLLLTFDDGFKSNFFFANTVLKKLKIKAIFFVVTDLISSNITNKKKTIQNIYPGKKLLKISEYKTMTWDDLRKLQKWAMSSVLILNLT